jgi:hypothetical protein
MSRYYYPVIRRERRKITNFSEDSRHPGRALNQEPPFLESYQSGTIYAMLRGQSNEGGDDGLSMQTVYGMHTLRWARKQI